MVWRMGLDAQTHDEHKDLHERMARAMVLVIVEDRDDSQKTSIYPIVDPEGASVASIDTEDTGRFYLRLSGFEAASAGA